MEKIPIETEYITLGQLLQLAEVIQSGGQAKIFLQEFQVFVNGEAEERRGRKCRPGDAIEIPSWERSFEVSART
ncbi:S4 domain-containing protein YaaA [Bacillus fonticola]|uniref:S4 domain-containing protein YaaA n=1 Tax=Bacillus fonticola TaxID=2728853 RepID=UPI001472CFDF|nr:S4 domain-containing protein YaaA [Bacillus fonticola]